MIINLRLKILISLFITLALSGVIYLVMDHTPDQVSTEEMIGEIQFKLFDASQSLIVDDTLTIYQDDNLYSLLNRHYALVCADQNYQADDSCSYKFVNGYALLGVDTVITNWHTTYLSIYVNDQVSTLGVSGIVPQDGDLIEIKVIHDE